MRDILRNSELMFEVSLTGDLLALSLNKSENIPVSADPPSSEDIKNFYVAFCAKLDRKTFKAYEKNLIKREIPDELVYPFGDSEKKDEVTISELMAYDALCMYTAKLKNRKFYIDKDGNLKIEDETTKEIVKENKKKPDKLIDDYISTSQIKSIDDDYYIE